MFVFIVDKTKENIPKIIVFFSFDKIGLTINNDMAMVNLQRSLFDDLSNK